jgi:ribose transport system ATP-binding protein
VRTGEVVGIAGLADSGQDTLGETIAGFRRLRDGTLFVKGRPVRFRNPRDAVAAGVGFLTSDRNASGIWRDFTISENIGLGALERFCSGGFISRDAVGEAANHFAKDFNIRCQGVEDLVGTLSGGNAQKVAIAKVLAANPAVLVLNELTQGVDVGARQEIYALLGELAGKGMAVVLVSSDMTELLGLCRRIAVMREGRIVGEVMDDRLTEKDIIRLATGTEEGSEKDI